MKILITGPQGSGKTTQAKILSEKLHLCFVGAGDIVRENALRDDEVGRECKSKMDKGELVDKELMSRLVQERLEKDDCKIGFISDSYPRNIDQAECFEPGFNLVFYLDISDQQAVQRLLARGRADDTAELIRERLKVYHQETEPLIGMYKKAGKLVVVNGNRTIEEIARDIEDRVLDIKGGEAELVRSE